MIGREGRKIIAELETELRQLRASRDMLDLYTEALREKLSSDSVVLEEVHAEAFEAVRKDLEDQMRVEMIARKAAEVLAAGMDVEMQLVGDEDTAPVIMVAHHAPDMVGHGVREGQETIEQQEQRRLALRGRVGVEGIVNFGLLRINDELDVHLYPQGTVARGAHHQDGIIGTQEKVVRSLAFSMIEPKGGFALVTHDSWADERDHSDYALPDNTAVTLGMPVNYDSTGGVLVLPTLRRGVNISLIHDGQNFATPDLEVGWVELAGKEIL